jgi:hypothetical protein
MLVVQFHPEHRPGQHHHDAALDFDVFFFHALRFSRKIVNMWVATPAGWRALRRGKKRRGRSEPDPALKSKAD